MKVLELDYPRRVWVSADELTAWVADAGNQRIAIWSRPDATSTAWSCTARFGSSGSGDSQFNAPTGVLVSVDGHSAWIADRNNNCVVAWSRPDAASTTWTYLNQYGSYGAGPSEFKEPNEVRLSADGLTAWITEGYGGNRVSIWTAT
ncbi:MAG: hypothetical protein ACR2J8_14680 [Thermomicrobiales bacterium]